MWVCWKRDSVGNRDRVEREVDPRCRLICGNDRGDLSEFDGNYIVELMTKVRLLLSFCVVMFRRRVKVSNRFRQWVWNGRKFESGQGSFVEGEFVVFLLLEGSLVVILGKILNLSLEFDILIILLHYHKMVLKLIWNMIVSLVIFL